MTRPRLDVEKSSVRRKTLGGGASSCERGKSGPKKITVGCVIFTVPRRKSVNHAVVADIAQDPHNLAMFMRYAEQYGGDSAAAQALMDAELARQGLRPTRSFADGSALPTSFGEVHERYEQSRVEPSMDAGIDAVRRRSDASVSSRKVPAPNGTVPAPAE